MANNCMNGLPRCIARDARSKEIARLLDVDIKTVRKITRGEPWKPHKRCKKIIPMLQGDKNALEKFREVTNVGQKLTPRLRLSRGRLSRHEFQPWSRYP